jgi:uncharacterized protein YjbI with pentapeptide repeats
LGGIAVLVGVYFAWANLKTTQEAQKQTQKNQADALQVAQEGQITDRFTKAIDQLGATDDKGNPRLELRLGGIYALERLAQESEKDHWPIMEVLTTYVRVHAPANKIQDKQTGSADAHSSSKNSIPLASKAPNPDIGNSQEDLQAIHSVIGPSVDIQAILTVLGRRQQDFEKGKDEYLNLEQTNLSGADLKSANLKGAHLQSAYLVTAILENAHLEYANLSSSPDNIGQSPNWDTAGADLRGADLFHAHLDYTNLQNTHMGLAQLQFAYLKHADLLNARLEWAQLADADLSNAQLGNAYLVNAILENADLEHASLSYACLENAFLNQANLEGAGLWGANLSGAHLNHAHLEGASLIFADLKRANLSGAHLDHARLEGAHLQDAASLTQEQVNSAIGNKDTELPPGL